MTQDQNEARDCCTYIYIYKPYLTPPMLWKLLSVSHIMASVKRKRLSLQVLVGKSLLVIVNLYTCAAKPQSGQVSKPNHSTCSTWCNEYQRCQYAEHGRCKLLLSSQPISHPEQVQAPLPQGEAWCTCASTKYFTRFSLKRFMHFLVHMRKVILTKSTEHSLKWDSSDDLTSRTLLRYYFSDVAVSLFQSTVQQKGNKSIHQKGPFIRSHRNT